MTLGKDFLVYAPKIYAYIATDSGVIDISDDIIQGEVRRVVNGVSQFSCLLNNRNRKYTGKLSRMDRIVVFGERIKKVQMFSGYLDRVPAFGLYSAKITISASCTLKRLQQTYWDPGLVESANLLSLPTQVALATNESGGEETDSGLGKMLGEVLVKVGEWRRDQISIGALPDQLLNLAFTQDQIANDPALIDKIKAILGISSLPSTPTTDSSTSVNGAPTRAVTPKILLPTSNYGYSLLDTTAIAEAAGFIGDPLYIAAACSISRTNGDPNYQQSYVSGDGKTYQRLGMWALDTQYIKNLTKKDALDPLKGAQLFYNWTEHGKKFAEVYAFRSNEYKQYYDSARTASTHTSDSKAVDWSVSTSTSSTQTSSTGTGFFDRAFPKVVEGDKTVSNQAASTNDVVPAYDSTVSMDTLKNIYGKTADEVKANLMTLSFMGHSVQIHKKAANALMAVQNEINALPGNDGRYQIRLIRTISGESGSEAHWHSFGIGVDINWDTNGYPKSGTGPTTHDIPNSWVQAFKNNGFQWGGDWTNPDYMHFQWMGGGTVSPTQGDASGDLGTSPLNYGIFKYLYAGTPIDSLSLGLRGEKAPVNDVSLLSTIQTICSASLRSFMSGPDGSFIAFYPDYFGIFGTKYKLILEDVEMINFSIDVSDNNLATDVFVAGGTEVPNLGTNDTQLQWVLSSGVASITQSAMMKMLLGVDIDKDPEWKPDQIYKRFGMRPFKAEFPNLIGGGTQIERIQAITLFGQKWAQQYSTQVQFTFMPEIMPGMRIYIKSHGVTVYVEEVSHNFSYESGFTTVATISSPAAVGGGLSDIGLPLGRI